MKRPGLKACSVAALALVACLAVSGGKAAQVKLAQIGPGGGGGDGGNAAEFEQFMVGVWFGSVRQGPILTEVTSRLNANKTFRSVYVTRSTGVTVEVSGKWRANVINATEGTLLTDPTEWWPKELCIYPNVCTPYNFTAQTSVIKKVGPDDITVDKIPMRRTERL